MKNTLTVSSLIKQNIEGEPVEMVGARRRFFANVSSNVVYTAASALANIFLTPFLIVHLGLAAYGMIPLVNTFTSYMAILTQALQASSSRFLTIDLGRGDRNFANKTFNTSLFGVLLMVLVLSIFVVAFSSLFPVLFNVPKGSESDVRWLFILIGFAFFVTVLAGVFSISPFAHSQFLLINSANFVALAIRIGLVIALFIVFPARLWFFGISTFLSAAITLGIFIGLWKLLTPELRVDIKEFDRSRLGDLLGMGGWSVVNTAGAMLLGRVDLLAVNTYFGAATTGAYGSIAQLTTFLDYLVNTVSTVLRQILTVKFSQGDLKGLRDIASRSVKFIGLMMALPIGILCGFAKPILSIWLGPSYAYLSLLLIVLVAHFSVNLSVRPLLYAQYAYNKIRGPGIVTVIVGIVNLGLVFLVGWLGAGGYIGIAVVGAVVWTIRNTIYLPLYTAKIMNTSWWVFYPSLGVSVVATLFVGLLSYAMAMVKMPDNFFILLSYFCLVTLIYGLLVWKFALSDEDRLLINDLSPVKFLK